MVRLSEMKSHVETCGTTGHTLSIGAIPDGMERFVYRVRAQQRGATLSNFYLLGNLGATLGATLDQFKFDVPNQIIDWPDGPLLRDLAPVYRLNRATYDSIFASVEVSSVDLMIVYEDVYH